MISFFYMLIKFKNEDGVDRKEEKNIWSKIQIGMGWRRQGLIIKGGITGGWFLRRRR